MGNRILRSWFCATSAIVALLVFPVPLTASAETLPDISPPSVSETTVLPLEVVKSSDNTSVTVSFRVTDATGTSIERVSATPKEWGVGGTVSCAPTLLSGTVQNGVWSCDLDFGSVNAPGIWSISMWRLCDPAGNCGSFTFFGEVEVFGEQLENLVRPTIIGAGQVGKFLEVDLGTWGGDLTFASFQWYRNGQPLPGEGGESYLVAPEDLNQDLQVSVVGHRWVEEVPYYYRPGTATSLIFTPASAGRIHAGSITVFGNSQPGSELRINMQGWGIDGFLRAWDGLSYDFQWLRHGQPINGATRDSYFVSEEDVAAELSVRVTASEPGFSEVTATSPVFQVDDWFTSPLPARLAGANRFETAVMISKSEFNPGSASSVVIATGYGFADALSAAPLATKLGGPLLLTQQDVLTPVTKDEVLRLDPDKVIIVGGEPAVGPEVMNELALLGEAHGFAVDRISGGDRFLTSLAIAEKGWGQSGASEAFVATGLNFPDALAAGAAAAGQGMPVVLVNGGATSLSQEQLEALDDFGVSTAHIAGADVAVSAGIEMQLVGLGLSTERYAGVDRIDTSALIADRFGSVGTRVYLAQGWNYPDALAAAAVAGGHGAALVLSQQHCLSNRLSHVFDELRPLSVTLVGGTPALSAAVARYEYCG